MPGFGYKLTLFPMGVGVEMATLIKEFIAKLIFNFNFMLEDEIALFSISPITHPPDKQWQLLTRPKKYTGYVWGGNAPLIKEFIVKLIFNLNTNFKYTTVTKTRTMATTYEKGVIVKVFYIDNNHCITVSVAFYLSSQQHQINFRKKQK